MANRATLSNGAAAPTATRVEIVPSNARRESVTFTNAGTVTVYLGTSSVTAANGTPLDPQEEFSDEDTGAAWYGITASGTADVRYLEATGGN